MAKDWQEGEDMGPDIGQPLEGHSSGPSLTCPGIEAIRGLPEEDSEVEREAYISDTQRIGNPEQDAQFWHEQRHDDTCAIAAQRGVLEKHTGQDYGEEALRQEAHENGWYAPGYGTSSTDVGNLLDMHGVPVKPWEDADMDSLRSELEQGHDVIAEVDAGYLWNDPAAIGEGHAVWVTGLEFDQGEEVAGVFLNDTGNPEIGGGGRVSGEAFRASWMERGNRMVSTQDSVRVSHAIGRGK